jgi:hypothetical protein
MLTESSSSGSILSILFRVVFAMESWIHDLPITRIVDPLPR